MVEHVLPPWFRNALFQMVKDQDGDDPWPGFVEAFRAVRDHGPTGAPLEFTSEGFIRQIPGIGISQRPEFWQLFRTTLAQMMVDGSIPPSTFASLTGLIARTAPQEMVDQQLRCIWYDLWGLEPVPGALAEVPWFLPGYTLSGYMVFLGMQARREVEPTADQQHWLEERNLVLMDVPPDLYSDYPSQAYLDPRVLDEAIARVRLGWVRRY